MRVHDTRPQEAIGMATTLATVQGRANHGWQPYDAANDNGVDGLIIIRKKDIDTGQLVFAQVKCGSPGGYYKEAQIRPNKFGVNVGQAYIETHRTRWNSVPGPMIMIYVDYETQKAWWTDLKNDDSYIAENRSLVLFDKRQVFERHSFGNFRKLKGYIFINPNYEELVIPNHATDYLHLNSNTSLKNQAKEYYQNWSNELVPQRTHASLGEITISRSGWRHLIRSGRRQNRIFNSLQLLGVAKEIILNTKSVFQVKVDKNLILGDGAHYLEDYLGIRAKCKFENRHSSVVHVSLKRKRWVNDGTNTFEQKVWFHSVYEPFVLKDI